MRAVAWLFPSIAAVTVGALIVGAYSSRLALPFVLNLTASMPRGVYRVVAHGDAHYARGMSVLMPVPAPLQGLVYGRHWLPSGALLIKPIGALAGDLVCSDQGSISVNDSPVGPVSEHDSAGAPLPRIRGCYRVPPGYFVALSSHHERSFDGRYFGPQPVSEIRAEVRPLWVF